jgi:hypothetical protein
LAHDSDNCRVAVDTVMNFGLRKVRGDEELSAAEGEICIKEQAVFVL